MENQRDDLVVILAGYKDRMDAFFRSNPGMSSRIAHHLDFPDYAPAELLKIAELLWNPRSDRSRTGQAGSKAATASAGLGQHRGDQTRGCCRSGGSDRVAFNHSNGAGSGPIGYPAPAGLPSDPAVTPTLLAQPSARSRHPRVSRAVGTEIPGGSRIGAASNAQKLTDIIRRP
jgi:hypothetical protein